MIQYKTFKRVCYCWTSGKERVGSSGIDTLITKRIKDLLKGPLQKKHTDMKISTGRFFTMKGNCLLSDIDEFITRHRITIEGKLKKLD